MNIIMCAGDEMRRLCTVTEETVTLDLMIGTQAFSVYEITSRHDLKVSQENKMPGPLLAGASVKALLSMLNDKQLDAALENMAIQRSTEHTVTDKSILKTQIKEIRRKGHSISLGEWIKGAICISVPVSNYHLPVSLSVVGPESRMKLHEKEAIDELKKSASRISANISRFFNILKS